MPKKFTRPPVNFDAKTAATLIELARQIPLCGWDFADWPGVSLNDLADADQFQAIISKARKGLAEDGFCVLRLGNIVVAQEDRVAASATTLLASAFGAPFRVYAGIPAHWRRVGVDLNKEPYRSEGIGQLPLHMDFVNAARPPDLICLVCIRPDPCGGGDSLVARIEGIEELLSAAEIRLLSQPIYRDGRVVNLLGIGGDINPFRVLSADHGDPFHYRWVGHLAESVVEPSARAAIRALARALEQRSVSIPLAAGDLMIVDQHKAVHGKLPLGQRQEAVPAPNHRLMLLSFLRSNPD